MNLESGGVRQEAPIAVDALSAIEPLLVCPACGSPLERREDELVGVTCRHLYPVRDGVARLAVLGSSETWGTAAPASSRAFGHHRIVSAPPGFASGSRPQPRVGRLRSWSR